MMLSVKDINAVAASQLPICRATVSDHREQVIDNRLDHLGDARVLQ